MRPPGVDRRRVVPFKFWVDLICNGFPEKSVHGIMSCQRTFERRPNLRLVLRVESVTARTLPCALRIVFVCLYLESQTCSTEFGSCLSHWPLLGARG
jgi:hypothetical protein